MFPKIQLLHSGTFQLDGGAMFGMIPKSMWQKKYAADEKNMCIWDLNLLYIEHGERKIIVDTGMGDADSPFMKHFNAELKDWADFLPVSCSEITDVFLTHLHFDHLGGSLTKNDAGETVTRFPNATYWTNKRQWEWAMNPNQKEQASFLPNLLNPLYNSGQLEILELPEDTTQLVEWLPNIHIRRSFGHTEDMMSLDIQTEKNYFIYTADLLPSHAHISLPWVMSFDVRPLVTLEEKKRLYKDVLEKDAVLIFEHDHYCETATLKSGANGRVKMDKKADLSFYF